MFGPDAPWAGISGRDGQITVIGGLAAQIAKWSIKRSGSHPDGRPKLLFRAWFSWRNDTLLKMCSRGELRARIRVFMLTKNGKEQVDVVNWDEWRIDEDGSLWLENIMHFDTEPLGIVRGGGV